MKSIETRRKVLVFLAAVVVTLGLYAAPSSQMAAPLWTSVSTAMQIAQEEDNESSSSLQQRRQAPPPLQLRFGQVDERRLFFTLTTWTNQYDVVHVITTNFMRNAGELAKLGMCRLDLFQTISLPGMLSQTNREFLWLIYIDEDLDPTILDILLYEVSGFPNAVVLAPPGRINRDFRSIDIETITPQMVLSGSYAYLLDYHTQAQDHLTLDTRLNLDDSLHPEFVQYIQVQASYELAGKVDSDAWRVWCTERVLEWRFYNDEPTTHPELDETGKMVDQVYENFCVETGLTVAYATEARSYDLPTVWQCVLHELIRRCNGPHDVQCLARVDTEGAIGVLRLRTAAGVGLRHMYPNTANPSQPTLAQDDLWLTMETDFPVTQENVLALKSRFEADGVMPDVLDEAVVAHCVMGMPCKPLYIEQLHLLRSMYE